MVSPAVRDLLDYLAGDPSAVDDYTTACTLHTRSPHHDYPDLVARTTTVGTYRAGLPIVTRNNPGKGEPS